MARYEYEPLPTSSSMRLLNLLPGTYEDELRCTIEQCDINNPPAYECISYVWGDTSIPTDITVMVDGSVANGGTIRIPENLSWALRRFRRVDSKLQLWADSICVDQNNIPEKNNQVSMMGAIFATAKVVLIWLGEESESGQAAAACRCMSLLGSIPLRRLADITKQHIRRLDQGDVGPYEKYAKRLIQTEFHEELMIPDFDSPEFQSLRTLVDNSWFIRAWTWQESLLARRRIFHWAAEQWDSKLLLEALIRVPALSELHDHSEVRETLYWVNTRDRIINMTHTTDILCLLDLLRKRRGSCCKHPCDIVYSLIYATGDIHDIKVDYSEPFERTYARTTFHIMQGSRGLNVLRTAVGCYTDTNLSSWVPDWREPESLLPQGAQTAITILSDHPLYTATGDSLTMARLSPNRETLHISGFRFTQVADVAKIGDDPYRWIREAISADSKRYRKYGLDYSQVFQLVHRMAYRDIVPTPLDRDAEGKPAPFARWGPSTGRQIMNIIAGSTSSARGAKGERRLEYLCRDFVESVNGKVMFITANDCFGSAFHAVRPGDIVVFLFGAEVPHILRPCNDDSQAPLWKFVAECYVHGFMDGEALRYGRQQARPDEKLLDESWQSSLDQGDFPYPVEEFSIV